MFKLVQNQIGGSIIMVLIMGSLIASGGVYFMKRHSTDMNSAKTEQISYDTEVLTIRVINQLAKDKSCLNTIGGTDIRTKTIDKIRNYANIVVFNTVDKVLHGNILLNKIDIQGEYLPTTFSYKTIEDSFGASPIPPGESRYGELNIILDIQKEFSKVFGAKVIKRKFSIIVKVDENYIVQNCFNNYNNLAKLTREQFCKDLGGAYNFNTGCVLIGGAGIGIKVKEVSCEIMGGVYDVLTGSCLGTDLAATCPAGEYMNGFDLKAKIQSCIAIPKT